MGMAKAEGSQLMPRRPTEIEGPSEESSGPGSGHSYPERDHSWTLQNLHHIGRDIGRLQEAVDGLKGDVADLKKQVHRINYIVAFATGALIVIGWFINYIIDKRFDEILAVIQKSSS
jgi:hypothetical protein